MKFVNILCALCLFLSACGKEQATDQQGSAADTEPSQGELRETPFAIGSSTFFIQDATRPYDSVGGIDDGIRTMITEIWYPVNHDAVASGEYRRATYGDYVFGDREVHRLMMTKTTFFHLTPETVRAGVTIEQIDAAIEELFLRQRASFIDAPLAASDNGWPVIVMTHGDAGSRYNMETACEYLAAHGYVVIAPEHTGNSPYSLSGRDPALAATGGDPDIRERMASVLPILSDHGTYGSEENYGQSYAPSSEGRGTIEFLKSLDQSLLQRLNDLRATLRELDRMNERGFAGQRSGMLKLDDIGLMGRSFGGATTLVGLAMEQRFTAGFAVVPPGWADPRPALPVETLAPAGQESVLLAADGDFPLTTVSKPTVLLSGGEDALIIGLAAQMAASGASNAPTSSNPHPLMRRAFEETTAPVVWGLLADSNHATFGVSGGFWWPELKPNTQARYFEPDVEFQLVAPAIGHQMQKELALNFFDLTIRHDESAKSKLMENRYQDKGLALESRNL